MEVIINTCLRYRIHFYNYLHGFCAGRGTGKATMDLKMVQELVSVNQEPLFLVLLVFLDLKKAYDTVYHGSLINGLVGK